MDRQEPCEMQQGQMVNPTTGIHEPLSMPQIGDCLLGEQLCGKGPEGSPGWKGLEDSPCEERLVQEWFSLGKTQLQGI